MPETASHDAVCFYSYKLLRTIAFIISHSFIPLYLFIQLQYSVFHVLLFITIIHVFLIPFVPLTGKIIEKLGVKRTISLHIFGMAIFFYLLQFLSGPFISDLPLIIALACIKSIPKAFFSTAETIFISEKILTSKKTDGRNLSRIQIVLILATILTPLIGGIVTYLYGFVGFFEGVALLSLVSAIPLWVTPDFRVKSKDTYKQIVSFTIKKMDRSVQLAEFGKNFSDSITQTIWPLFIIFVVQTTLHFGTLLSISAFLGIFVSYFLGKEIDKKPHEKILPFMTKLSAGIFFLRAIYPSPSALLITDATNNITKPLLNIPYNKYLYSYIKSFKNHILSSVTYVLYSEIIYFVGFLVITLYFGALELLNAQIDHVLFLIPFIVYGASILLMGKISKSKNAVGLSAD